MTRSFIAIAIDGTTDGKICSADLDVKVIATGATTSNKWISVQHLHQSKQHVHPFISLFISILFIYLLSSCNSNSSEVVVVGNNTNNKVC
jgi:hypothetical protein